MFHQELKPQSLRYQDDNNQYSQYNSHLQFLLEAHKNVLKLKAQNNAKQADFCLPVQTQLKPFGASVQ